MRYWPPATDQHELCPDPSLQTVYEVKFTSEIERQEALHDDPPHIIAIALANVLKTYLAEIHGQGGLSSIWATGCLEELSDQYRAMALELSRDQPLNRPVLDNLLPTHR